MIVSMESRWNRIHFNFSPFDTSNVSPYLKWSSDHTNKAVQRTAISLAVIFLEHFVFLLTWPKLYTTTGQEWENRKYKLFDQ